MRERFVATMETGRDGRLINVGALRGLAAELGVTMEEISLSPPPANQFSVRRDGKELFLISDFYVSEC